ncbi:MAG: hypothetical protein NZ480_07160 [Bdellovibrionaceae bacterium]|nr:hypothetical protein [Pseudobdellovibrionaceae bacterium]
MFKDQEPSIFEWSQKFYLHNWKGKFYSFLETTSTNDLAKESFPETVPLLFLAKRQTKGRGQYGRTWQNPINENGALLITYSYPVKKPVPPQFSLEMSQILREAIQRIWNISHLTVKSPNDLYLNTSKVAGFLCEMISQGDRHQLIIGLGLNVFSAPKDVPVAGYLLSINDVTEDDWYLFLKTWDHLREELIIKYSS